MLYLYNLLQYSINTHVLLKITIFTSLRRFMSAASLFSSSSQLMHVLERRSWFARWAPRTEHFASPALDSTSQCSLHVRDFVMLSPLQSTVYCTKLYSSFHLTSWVLIVCYERCAMLRLTISYLSWNISAYMFVCGRCILPAAAILPWHCFYSYYTLQVQECTFQF